MCERKMTGATSEMGKRRASDVKRGKRAPVLRKGNESYPCKEGKRAPNIRKGKECTRCEEGKREH